MAYALQNINRYIDGEEKEVVDKESGNKGKGENSCAAGPVDNQSRLRREAEG